jgi:hypothetical protein
MRFLKRSSAAISIAVGLAAQAAEPPFTGRFLGTGWACYGALAIQAKTVSWLTSFSQCKALPVALADRDESGGSLRITYRFTRSASSCRFSVVSLFHDGSKDQNTGWQIVGYVTMASFLAGKASGYTMNTPDMMSCYLIPDAAKKLGHPR